MFNFGFDEEYSIGELTLIHRNNNLLSSPTFGPILLDDREGEGHGPIFDLQSNQDFSQGSRSNAPDAPLFQNISTPALSQPTQYVGPIPQSVFSSPVISGSPSFHVYPESRRSVSVPVPFNPQIPMRSPTPAPNVGESYSRSFNRFGNASSRLNRKRDMVKSSPSNSNPLPVFKYTPPAATTHSSRYRDATFELVHGNDTKPEDRHGDGASVSHYSLFLKQTTRFVSVNTQATHMCVSLQQSAIDTSSITNSPSPPQPSDVEFLRIHNV